MKVMYLTPLGISGYTQFIAEMVKEYKDPETEVHVCSLNPSVGSMANLEHRTFETLVLADTLKAVHQAKKENFDAIVVGNFHDPGLHDCREIAGDMLVIGLFQSSCEVASRISNRFSVIIGQWKSYDQLKTVISNYGYAHKLASLRSADITMADFIKDPKIIEAKIMDQINQAIDTDHTESVILNCALELGQYERLQNQVGARVIDPPTAALKTAEHAASLKIKCDWSPSKKWSMEPPDDKDLVQFKILQGDYAFGSRLVIKAEK